MARTPVTTIGQKSVATLELIYTVRAGVNASSTVLTITNAAATDQIIDIYVGDGTDYLQTKLTVPSGIGRHRTYYDIGNLAATNTVKIQASSATAFNFKFSASEIEI